jgi:UvrD/REP helicase N-terminal domain
MPLQHRFASLNPEQRRAAEHGIAGPNPACAGPLLIIPGAGSGKTRTLAHRVAQLMVKSMKEARLAMATIKQRLAAVKAFFDYLVTGGIIPVNPALSVRGPKYSIRGARRRCSRLNRLGSCLPPSTCRKRPGCAAGRSSPSL